MAQFAAIGSLIGSGMQALGQYRAGKDQERAFKQRASVLDADAVAVEKASMEEQRAKRLEGKRIGAMQLVDFQGLGGALVMAETRREIDRDAEFIAQEGIRGASRLRSQASGEREMGKSARRAGMWQAGTSLLTGGARFAMQGEKNAWWSKKKYKQPLYRTH